MKTETKAEIHTVYYHGSTRLLHSEGIFFYCHAQIPGPKPWL